MFFLLQHGEEAAHAAEAAHGAEPAAEHAEHVPIIVQMVMWRIVSAIQIAPANRHPLDVVVSMR